MIDGWKGQAFYTRLRLISSMSPRFVRSARNTRKTMSIRINRLSVQADKPQVSVQRTGRHTTTVRVSVQLEGMGREAWPIVDSHRREQDSLCYPARCSSTRNALQHCNLKSCVGVGPCRSRQHAMEQIESPCQRLGLRNVNKQGVNWEMPAIEAEGHKTCQPRLPTTLLHRPTPPP